MSIDFQNLELTKNEANHRFELEVNGFIAFIDYKERNSVMTLIHTEAPPELQGTGSARSLVEKTLQYLEANQYTLIPFCPFVFSYIRKNPEWKRIVDESFKKFD